MDELIHLLKTKYSSQNISLYLKDIKHFYQQKYKHLQVKNNNFEIIHDLDYIYNSDIIYKIKRSKNIYDL